MKHATFVPDCNVCRYNAGEEPDEGELVFENDLWVLRHSARGLAGWATLSTQRHVRGIADFNDEEAANFGPALRHLEKCLEEVTGALRIYTASLNETYHHFHCHLVPRYAAMPRDMSSWSAFQLSRMRDVIPDPTEVSRITRDIVEALLHYPPPR